MTHEYTLLVNGTVIAGPDSPPATAVAWAGETVLAMGGDADWGRQSRADGGKRYPATHP